MTWDDVLTRLTDSGLNPSEEIYMENYGKILSADRPEFHERYFRCTYGVVSCDGITLELFLLPDETQRDDFMDVIARDPWWVARDNLVVHFPECDPSTVAKVMSAIGGVSV
jgi:hypothetical protein